MSNNVACFCVFWRKSPREKHPAPAKVSISVLAGGASVKQHLVPVDCSLFFIYQAEQQDAQDEEDNHR